MPDVPAGLLSASTPDKYLLAFSALKLHPTLLKGVESLGFTQPTPIQSEAIPHAMDGRDLLACAATGSGKTAAFLLPILHQLVDRPRGTTRALVLAPTRELALQILADLNALGRFTGLKAAAVHGGVGMGPQETAFRRGVDAIIATPGRLLDHFQYGYATLSGLEYLVLDEADRMLDMGFLPDIKRVLKHVPTPKQTFFFSATMPQPIEKLTHEILRKPARIALQRRAAPPKTVTQAVYPVRQTLKGTLLVELFKAQHMDDALVFTRTKHRADRLCKLLNRNGIIAERIHGNRSQAQRTRALAGFKAGDFQVLVATDIAARGIDVDALGHVVNFDIPTVPEDYIHRVGRTRKSGAHRRRHHAGVAPGRGRSPAHRARRGLEDSSRVPGRLRLRGRPGNASGGAPRGAHCRHPRQEGRRPDPLQGQGGKDGHAQGRWPAVGPGPSASVRERKPIRGERPSARRRRPRPGGSRRNRPRPRWVGSQAGKPRRPPSVGRAPTERAKPHTTLSLTEGGRSRFATYLRTLHDMLEALGGSE